MSGWTIAALAIAALAWLLRGGFRRLHAARLRFTHPVTGEQLDIQAPMPEDCAALLKVLDEKGGR